MKTIPVYASDTQFSVSALEALPPLVLDTDWKGARGSFGVRFILAVDCERLHFIAQAPFTGAGPARSEFVEGLWEEDLVEFFLKSDSSTRYQEFNLAPDGRWWSAVFSGYRQRSGICHMKGVQTFSQPLGKETRWGISVPRAALAVDIEFSAHSRMNVTAIRQKPSPEYLIWSPCDGPEPDFHRLDMAASVERRQG